jgi:FkbM family methyltransferase
LFILAIKSLIQRVLRKLGWELQRFENAHVEQQVLKKILSWTGAEIVLDVGANVGQYGDLVFETGFEGTVISFEAIPTVHQKLSAHARRKSRRWIVAPCAALGTQRGNVAINVSANLVSSSVLPMLGAHLDAAPESRYVRQQTVAVERLDEFAPALLPPTGQLLIKVDTQGYEMQVLKGAIGLLPRTVAIQLELSLLPLYEGAPTFTELIAFVQASGFELFSIIPGFRDPRSGRLLQADGFFVRAEARPRADG